MTRDELLLARKVAHEINNPLTGILGFCQLLLQDGQLTPFQREALEHIQSQSFRCRSVLRNLLRDEKGVARAWAGMLNSRNGAAEEDPGTR